MKFQRLLKMTKKNIKLVSFELPLAVAWVLKIIALIAAIYFLYDVYMDISNGYVVRRGNQYTLEGSPTAFYLNIAKRLIFSALFGYLAFWGIKFKKKEL